MIISKVTVTKRGKQVKLFQKRSPGYWLVLAFILLIPFCNGLISKGFFLGSLSFILLFTTIFIIKTKRIRIDKKLFLVFIFQVLFAIISTINGINREEAIFGLFKILFAPLLFFVILNLDILRKDNSPENSATWNFDSVVLVIFLSGSLISIINILLNIFESDSINNYRFDAILGYANTLALFVFICSLAGMYLLFNNQYGKLSRAMLLSGVFFNFFVLIFSYSRIMWILSILGYIIFFHVCVLKMKRIKKIDYFVVSALLLAIACALLLSGTNIFNRIASIGFGATELKERFAYYNDALRIIKDFPLFGTGAGGWSSIQFKYQTALYSVKYVHSSIFQTALNYGIAGLGIFVLQIFIFIYYSVRSLKHKDYRIRKAALVAIICNTVILLHSALDFDMEFSLVVMIFWVNMAFLSSLSGNITEINFKRKTKNYLSIIISVLIFLIIIPIFISDIYYLRGVNAYNSKSYLSAGKSLKKAIAFNHYSSNARFAYGKSLVSLYEYGNNSEKLKSSIEYYFSAEKYDRYNPRYAEERVEVFINIKDYKSCVSEYRRLILLSPMKIEYYEGLSESLLMCYEYDIKSGETISAKKNLDEVLKITNSLKIAQGRVSEISSGLKHKLSLKITPELAYNIGRAYLYLGHKEKAIKYFSIASEGKDIPHNWLNK